MGRTWQESFNKALVFGNWLIWLGLEQERWFHAKRPGTDQRTLVVPSSERIVALHEAFMSGMSEDEIVRLTTMDPWFIRQLGDLYQKPNVG